MALLSAGVRLSIPPSTGHAHDHPLFPSENFSEVQVFQVPIVCPVPRVGGSPAKVVGRQIIISTSRRHLTTSVPTVGLIDRCNRCPYVLIWRMTLTTTDGLASPFPSMRSLIIKRRIAVVWYSPECTQTTDRRQVSIP